MADPEFEALVKRTIDMHRPALEALSVYDEEGDETAEALLDLGHRGTFFYRIVDGWVFRLFGWGVQGWVNTDIPWQAAIVSAPHEGNFLVVQVGRYNLRLLTPRT